MRFRTYALLYHFAETLSKGLINNPGKMWGRQEKLLLNQKTIALTTALH